jgi:AcrR family transcriptional regulator
MPRRSRANPPPPKRPARRRRRKAARPAELAEAALELFLERGFDATRLEDVAARAGVAKGTVYLYFASKDALFDGVIRQAILPAVERGEQRLDRSRGATSKLLHQILRDWMQLMMETPLGGVPSLVASESRKFPDLARVFHDTVMARARRLVRAVLERGVQRGEFRVADLDMTAEVITAAVLMHAVGRYSPGFNAADPPDPDRYIDVLVELALRGIVAR